MADQDQQTDPFTGTTHIAVVLDKSGSMRPLAQEVISGFNAWLDDQKKLPGAALLTLSLFDTAVQVPIVATDIARVNPLDDSRYAPSGCTALYDAVFKAVGKMQVPAEDRALVLVITDGQENSSCECEKAQMRKLIQEKEALGNWTFTYLSASIDAFADAKQAGVQHLNTGVFTATPTGTRAAFAGMRGATLSYRASGMTASADFYGPSQEAGADLDNLLGQVQVPPPAQRVTQATGWTSPVPTQNESRPVSTAWTKE